MRFYIENYAFLPNLSSFANWLIAIAAFFMNKYDRIILVDVFAYLFTVQASAILSNNTTKFLFFKIFLIIPYNSLSLSFITIFSGVTRLSLKLKADLLELTDFSL